MKLLATILLAYFSLLLVQPSVLHGSSCCTKHEVSKMACCQKEKKSAKPIANKSTAPFCCPFCNCCFGFVVSNSTSEVAVIEETVKSVTQYIQPNSSTFASDCWRPPENTGCLLG
ncbi:MAG TPA: hypothetical protein VK806_05720 [Bacteroidia bacterium]|nr:hypothetical protein [Bacteroidia bacterium]